MDEKPIRIKLDFRSGIPIYVQIMDQVRQMVTGGELQPGDQLPTVRQLAADLRINWNTVARAYKLLDEAGLISSQQGRGTYIWERPSEEISLKLRQQALEEFTQRYLVEVARLGCSPEDVAAVFEQQLQTWKNGSRPDERI